MVGKRVRVWTRVGGIYIVASGVLMGLEHGMYLLGILAACNRHFAVHSVVGYVSMQADLFEGLHLPGRLAKTFCCACSRGT